MTDTEIPALKVWPFGGFADEEISAVATFLKERDENVLPEEVDDEEREGSAMCILGLIAERRRHTVEAQPVALEWNGCEARSPLGDLYVISGLSENVWVTYWNGTAFTGWKSTREAAKEVAQSDYETRAAAPTPPSRAEVTPEMVEAGAKAVHDHWQNAPHGRPWSETCQKLPAQADDFRAKSRAVLEAALGAGKKEGE